LAGEIGKAVIADTLLADVGQLISVLGALPASQAATLTAVMLHRAIREYRLVSKYASVHACSEGSHAERTFLLSVVKWIWHSVHVLLSSSFCQMGASYSSYPSPPVVCGFCFKLSFAAKQK
jgi:hypothetical protein